MFYVICNFTWIVYVIINVIAEENIYLVAAMTVESNILTTTSLFNDAIKSEFVTSVRNSLISMINDTKISTLNYDLTIIEIRDNSDSRRRRRRRRRLTINNDNNHDNIYNNNNNPYDEFRYLASKRSKQSQQSQQSQRVKPFAVQKSKNNSKNRNLLQYSSGGDDDNNETKTDSGSDTDTDTDESDSNTIISHIFDYDISIEWEIKIADKSTKLILENILIDHNVNISNFIVKDYFGIGEAFITIEIISSETTTTSQPVIPTTGESSKNEKNEFNIFGFKFSFTDIVLFGAVGVLIILACCVLIAIRCTCRSRKDFHRKSAKVKFLFCCCCA